MHLDLLANKMLDAPRVRARIPLFRPDFAGLLVRAQATPHGMAQMALGRPFAVEHLADELRGHPSGVADDVAGHVDGRRLALERHQPFVEVVEDLAAETGSYPADVPPALPFRQREQQGADSTRPVALAGAP